MTCPRCDAPLVNFSLGENAASVCERCGHVGILTDLGAVVEPDESWDSALARFRDAE